MNRKKVSAAAIWHGLTAETFLYMLTGWRDERDRIPENSCHWNLRDGKNQKSSHVRNRSFLKSSQNPQEV